jgi:hypothetical protein
MVDGQADIVFSIGGGKAEKGANLQTVSCSATYGCFCPFLPCAPKHGTVWQVNGSQSLGSAGPSQHTKRILRHCQASQSRQELFKNSLDWKVATVTKLILLLPLPCASSCHALSGTNVQRRPSIKLSGAQTNSVLISDSEDNAVNSRNNEERKRKKLRLNPSGANSPCYLHGKTIPRWHLCD